MALSAKKQKTSSATESSSSKAANTVVDASWVNVTKGIKHTTMTFNPTIVETPITPQSDKNSSNQSLMTEETATSESVEMVRPFLKGIEDSSVLIDITGLPNQQLLRDALQAFNKNAHLYKGYNDYIGRVPRNRKYMNREIMETCWIHDSPGHQAILKGFKLKDGTFVKGFTSLPANDTIVNVHLDRLPMEPVPVLKTLIRDRLSHFGEVLDYGISFTQGDYVGQGYATLNITPKPNEPAYEALDRIIYFRLENGVNRQVLLKWQDMPDFCRLCQKPDHCKADCPDARKYMQCFNCNQHGHKSRNCPRQDDADTPSKKPATLPKKERKTPSSTTVVLQDQNPPIGPRTVARKNQETTDTDSANQQQQSSLDHPQSKPAGHDDVMELDPATTKDADHVSDGATDAGTSHAQTAQAQQQTKEADTDLGSQLTNEEIIQQLIPDETMNEPLTTERPEAADSHGGKKLRKQQDESDVSTARRPRGSRASKYSTSTQPQQDDSVDLNTTTEQATTDTAQSNAKQLE
ncbi:CCHC-type zinc finger transcription factor [Mucor lusitanicus CBS 277.49]|uniref:CCHC-type zinc finger transcription factor n=1 Tax=Mucor lusitanicus CBS 277.49 TaxID=747725 RepID=A0A168M2E9_MUCCL|nr:CCHC-type zinc finger transcription factor [Mucor lusitanicus CBS 277.49]